MGLFDKWFSSSKKNTQLVMRQNTLAAERSMGKLEENLSDMNQRRTQCWEQAKSLLQSGKKEDAAMMLQEYKLYSASAAKTNQMILVTKSRMTSMQNAVAMKDMTDAISGMAAAMDFNAGDMMVKMDELDMTIEQIQSVEDGIAGIASRDAKNLDKQLAKNALAGDDYLMQKLQEEALGGIAIDAAALSSTADNRSEGRIALEQL